MIAPIDGMVFWKSGGGRSVLAGVEGFEPPHDGTKTRCLTTWRHPSAKILIDNTLRFVFVQACLQLVDIFALFEKDR